MMMCGGPLYASEMPDAGEGACCMGAAFSGPQRCTCWKSKYDRRQRKPIVASPQVRSSPCGDCAYRADSPERNGADGYQCNDGELDAIVQSGQRFYCHQGIRQPTHLRHPSGAVVAAPAADYDPPIIDGVPYKANGMPADICANWAALSARAITGEPES